MTETHTVRLLGLLARRRRVALQLGLVLALAAARPAAAAVELIDIQWSATGEFKHQGQLAAGAVVELCGKLPAGQRVDWQFAASAPADFNIHHHEGKAVIYSARLPKVQRAQQVLLVKVEQDYCWMWKNLASQRSDLQVMLKRAQ